MFKDLIYVIMFLGYRYRVSVSPMTMDMFHLS